LGKKAGGEGRVGRAAITHQLMYRVA